MPSTPALAGAMDAGMLEALFVIAIACAVLMGGSRAINWLLDRARRR